MRAIVSFIISAALLFGVFSLWNLLMLPFFWWGTVFTGLVVLMAIIYLMAWGLRRKPDKN